MHRNLVDATAKSIMALTVVAGLTVAHPLHAQDADIVGTAREAGQFETLLAGAEAAGLLETLTGSGPMTLFAPTDAAFASLPEGTVESLMLEENLDQLADLLSLHIVPSEVTSGALSDGETLTSLTGEALDVGLAGTSVTVNGVAIVTPDIAATNGVIHMVDAVILPTGL